MYATIHRYAVSVGSTMDDLADIGRHLGAVLTQQSGFVAAMAVGDGSDSLVTISIFEDRASLAAAQPLADQWTAQHYATLCVDTIEVAIGEVLAQKGL